MRICTDMLPFFIVASIPASTMSKSFCCQGSGLKPRTRASCVQGSWILWCVGLPYITHAQQRIKSTCPHWYVGNRDHKKDWKVSDFWCSFSKQRTRNRHDFLKLVELANALAKLHLEMVWSGTQEAAKKLTTCKLFTHATHKIRLQKTITHTPTPLREKQPPHPHLSATAWAKQQVTHVFKLETCRAAIKRERSSVGHVLLCWRLRALLL